MAVISMKQFIEAGVHYGHQTRRWNPKMKPFIFGSKNGIHIIDLQKSLRQLRDAYTFVRELSARGESVLFVGTKHQARDIIREEAVRSNSFYINERWLGGLLTNFNTVKQSISQLKKMEETRGPDGLYPGLIKKEAVMMEKKRVKLESALGGIKEMRRLPGAVFIIDCKKERIAIQESQKLGVPIVAVVDTNCDPDHIDIVVPGNDDAIRAIKLFSATIAEAVIEGRAIYDAHARSVPEEKPKSKARPARTRKEEPKAEPAKAAAAAEPVKEEAPAAEVAAPVKEEPAKEAAAPEAAAEDSKPAKTPAAKKTADAGETAEAAPAAEAPAETPAGEGEAAS